MFWRTKLLFKIMNWDHVRRNRIRLCLSFKGAVINSIPINFCQIQYISPYGPANCPFLCAEKISDACTQPRLCKWRSKESGPQGATGHYSCQSAIGGIFQPISGHRERSEGKWDVIVGVITFATHVHEFGGLELQKENWRELCICLMVEFIILTIFYIILTIFLQKRQFPL